MLGPLAAPLIPSHTLPCRPAVFARAPKSTSGICFGDENTFDCPLGSKSCTVPIEKCRGTVTPHARTTRYRHAWRQITAAMPPVIFLTPCAAAGPACRFGTSGECMDRSSLVCADATDGDKGTPGCPVGFEFCDSFTTSPTTTVRICRRPVAVSRHLAGRPSRVGQRSTTILPAPLSHARAPSLARLPASVM